MSCYFTPRGQLSQEAIRFGDYLSGLTDGEGYFVLVLDKERISRSWAQYGMNLRCDDLSILKQIRAFLRCGSVKIRRGSGQNPQAVYSVTRTHDLTNIIIPFFTSHPLRAKKARDFIIWKEGIRVLHRIRSKPRTGRGKGGGVYRKWTTADVKEYEYYYHELKNIRAYIGPSAAEVRIIRPPKPKGLGIF